jgi:arginine-tRNA-protein transferase
MDPVPFIHEAGTLDQARAVDMDRLWSMGWRHFGNRFFRYSHELDPAGEPRLILPLRLDLERFAPSKSQRRIIKRNADLDVRIVDAIVDEEREELFQRHITRFRDNVPDSLRVFMPSPEPARLPCRCLSVEVRIGGALAAVSYMDVGLCAVSSVYAMFDPVHSHQGLGIFTLLEEIRWARRQGMRWLYPGYATREPSPYDYKKSLRPLEYYDWQGHWRPMDEGPSRGAAENGAG